MARTVLPRPQVGLVGTLPLWSGQQPLPHPTPSVPTTWAASGPAGVRASAELSVPPAVSRGTQPPAQPPWQFAILPASTEPFHGGPGWGGMTTCPRRSLCFKDGIRKTAGLARECKLRTGHSGSTQRALCGIGPVKCLFVFTDP